MPEPTATLAASHGNPVIAAARHQARRDAEAQDLADEQAHHADTFEGAVKAGDLQATLPDPWIANTRRTATLATVISEHIDGERIAALLLRLRAEGDFEATRILMDVQREYAETAAEATV